MHYISYKWGKEKLWNDKFDYVFRIRLKELLSNWTVRYGTNIDDDILSCFVHYCLDSKDIKLEDIKSIQDEDRILLLLDGDDKVAFLSQSNRDYRDIMDSVFQYKNIVMSSRPNAVVEEMRNRFARKVDNTGWDSEGIEQYVHKNFEYDKELGVQLQSFLDTHSQIKEICEVPINTTLICLVWSDQDIRDQFHKNSDEDFNISRLYSEIINWLNNRHLEKTQNKYKNKTEANDIDEVIEQGLLRREGQNFQFIHLTFQEYLAACYLKNQLADNNTKYTAANFIGAHRNDPKYLMTLKFLAGMVSNENNQELIEIFWEAVTCNVDGILELGIERKIILLMHLLAQSKINGKFNSRIPYLKQIQELIDEIILKDITDWEQHIIDSGYLSEAIVKTVNEKLQNKKPDPQEFKTVIGIITSLINKNTSGNKTKIYKKLTSLLEIKDEQLQKLVLQKLAQILDETIDEMVIRESVNTITSLLNIWELNRCVNIILIEIINTISDLDEELLKQVQKLQNKSLVTTSMIEIVKAKPSLAKEAFKVLKELVNDSNESIKFAVIDGIVEIVKAKPSLVKEALNILKELLSDDVVKYAAVDSIVEIVKIMHTTEAFDALKELLSDLDIDNYTHSHVKEEAVRS